MQVPWSREWALNWLCLCHWALGISDCPVGRSRKSASTRPKDLLAHFLLSAAWEGGLGLGVCAFWGVCVPGLPSPGAQAGSRAQEATLADGYRLGKAGFWKPGQWGSPYKESIRETPRRDSGQCLGVGVPAAGILRSPLDQVRGRENQMLENTVTLLPDFKSCVSQYSGRD